MNIRKGPSTDFDVLGMLNLNDAVSVVGESKSSPWKEIQYQDGTAFVHGGYLLAEPVDLEALRAQQEAARAAEAAKAAEDAAKSMEDELNKRLEWSNRIRHLNRKSLRRRESYSLEIPEPARCNRQPVVQTAAGYVNTDKNMSGLRQKQFRKRIR